MTKCCSMPNDKHDTSAARCAKCGIVKWTRDMTLYYFGIFIWKCGDCYFFGNEWGEN